MLTPLADVTSTPLAGAAAMTRIADELDMQATPSTLIVPPDICGRRLRPLIVMLHG